MIKALVLLPAILVFICPAYEGLECYNCVSDFTQITRGYKLNKCNEKNLTASDTLVCPDSKSKCIYEVLENEYIRGHQIWRTCSDPKYDPCDVKSTPPGFKMLECIHCDTDRCNLHKNNEGNTFTININANVSVSFG